MKRKIIIIGVTIICVISLFTLSCFASNYQIDNLQSYSLIFNNRVYEIEEASAFVYTFNINFTVGSNNNNLSMRAMRISNDGLAFIIEYMSLQNHQWVTAYDNGWTNNEYKYIVIKSGEDCTNQWLCNFINNSIVAAGIQHEILDNPYQNAFSMMSGINSLIDNYINNMQNINNYYNAIKSIGILALPANLFVNNNLIISLTLGGIIISLTLLIKHSHFENDIHGIVRNN